jgi:hypothetical protein
MLGRLAKETLGEVHAMTLAEARQTLDRVAGAIAQIHLECRTRLGDVEHGLVNVKREFRERAIRETGKKLTEERLIAWLVYQKLGGADQQVYWEMPYPGSRRSKCDLVMHVGDAGRLWLELKLAWKAWFNCLGRPTYANNSYLPHLQGKHHTHSFRHDFEKLGTADISDVDYRAVCLVGFDWTQAPMNAEVAAVVQAAREDGPWVAATERCWPDRRCSDFRINIWSWVLPPQTRHAEPGGSTDGGGTAASSDS